MSCLIILGKQTYLLLNHFVQVLTLIKEKLMSTKEQKQTKDAVTTEDASNVINIMFSRLSPEDRNRILNIIDKFITHDLGIDESDIPWLNSKKNKVQDFVHVLNLMRLSYAKVFNHSEINFKKKVH
ncbi:MAG: hypothetical protein CMP38_05640 [Rickettsiales bacterium]|nr:hypothetical protein [Rickettsiales bacterium]